MGIPATLGIIYHIIKPFIPSKKHYHDFQNKCPDDVTRSAAGWTVTIRELAHQNMNEGNNSVLLCFTADKERSANDAYHYRVFGVAGIQRFCVWW